MGWNLTEWQREALLLLSVSRTGLSTARIERGARSRGVPRSRSGVDRRKASDVLWRMAEHGLVEHDAGEWHITDLGRAALEGDTP